MGRGLPETRDRAFSRVSRLQGPRQPDLACKFGTTISANECRQTPTEIEATLATKFKLSCFAKGAPIKVRDVGNTSLPNMDLDAKIPDFGVETRSVFAPRPTPGQTKCGRRRRHRNPPGPIQQSQARPSAPQIGHTKMSPFSTSH